jgi:hypothetical protein
LSSCSILADSTAETTRFRRSGSLRRPLLAAREAGQQTPALLLAENAGAPLSPDETPELDEMKSSGGSPHAWTAECAGPVVLVIWERLPHVRDRFEDIIAMKMGARPH